MADERIVLIGWEAIDQIIDDEWDGLTPAMRSAVHSLREYTRAMGNRLQQLRERITYLEANGSASAPSEENT